MRRPDSFKPNPPHQRVFLWFPLKCVSALTKPRHSRRDYRNMHRQLTSVCQTLSFLQILLFNWVYLSLAAVYSHLFSLSRCSHRLQTSDWLAGDKCTNGHLCDSSGGCVVSHQSVVRQCWSDVNDELNEAELSCLENRQSTFSTFQLSLFI